MTIAEWMKQVEERLEKATPVNKWKSADEWFHDCSVGCRISETEELEYADTELIARAPTDLEAALKVIKTLIEQRNDMCDGPLRGAAMKFLDKELDAIVSGKGEG